MIPCTDDCVYQTEGVCGLKQAASSGTAEGVCRNRVKKPACKPL